MSIKNIFREVNKVLDSYDATSVLLEQSKVFTTELYYIKSWARGVVVDTIQAYLKKGKIDLTSEQVRQITNACDTIFKNVTNYDEWNKLLKGKFIVLTGKLNKEGVPSDYIEGRKKQVSITEIPNGVKLTFYQSYTAEHYKEDFHGIVQRNYTQKLVMATIEQLKKQDRTIVRRFEMRDDNFQDRTKSTIFDRQGLFDAQRAKGYRLHGVPNSMIGAGGRSDTTRHLIHFLTKMQLKTIPKDGTDEASMTYIKAEINRALNAEYTIEGISKLDAFNNQKLDKKTVIKIIFGQRSQQSVMDEADKRGVEKFLKALQGQLLETYKNPKLETSKSIAELAADGVFALVPKEMKRASGLPDMRFKLNKQLFYYSFQLF